MLNKASMLRPALGALAPALRGGVLRAAPAVAARPVCAVLPAKMRCISTSRPRMATLSDEDEIQSSTGKAAPMQSRVSEAKKHVKKVSPAQEVDDCEDEIFSSVGKMLNPEVSLDDLKAVEVAFDLIDEDANGIICAAELASLEAVMIDAGFSADEVRTAINNMDKNQNGEVCKEEFAHWWFEQHHCERTIKMRKAVKEIYSGEGKGDDRSD